MCPEDAQPTVNCPQCGAKVAPGEAICPKCDHILDASFLGGSAPAEADDEVTGAGGPPGQSDRTNIGVAPKAPAASTAQRVSTGSRPALKSNTGQRPAIKSGPNPIPRTGGTSGSNKAVKSSPLTARPANMPEPETEAATNIVPPKASSSGTSSRAAVKPAARPPPPRAPEPEEEAAQEQEEDIPTGKVPPKTGPVGPPRSYSGQSMVAPDQALDDFKGFVTDLPVGDKVAFMGAALTVLTTFLPWKETAAEGEILGLMSLGIVVFLVMIAVIGAIVIRVRRVMPQLHPLVPWLVQLGGTVFAALWCIIYIGLSIDSRKTQALIGNFEVSVSSPAFGVFLALLCCGATAAGTLMGLKARPT